MKRWCVRDSLEIGKDFCHVVTNPGFDVPRVGCHNEADEADDEAQVAHSPSQGYFKFWGAESCSQKGDHCLCIGTPRERAPTAKICLAIRVRHLATQGRETSRSDGPNKAVRAQGGAALPVTRVFQTFGYRIMFLKR